MCSCKTLSLWESWVSEVTHLWSVDTQSLFRDFELTGGVPKAHKSQHPDQNANSIFLDALERSDIDCLTVISKPIAKVDTLQMTHQ